MQYINLLLILLPAVRGLSCPSFYDYTSDTVACRQSCPAGAKIKDNKCLQNNQYVIGQEVHLCERGWVDDASSICCPRTHYPTTYNNQSACARCHTRVFGNGKICCAGSYYADFSNQNNPTCTSIATGSCATINMRSIFKVCCPSGMFYHLEEERCVSAGQYNCDNN